MHRIFNNVNDAFTWMVRAIRDGLKETPTHKSPLPVIPTVSTPSRYGAVHRISGGPVTITYLYPCQRILWNPERDCNPFFHLFECLWMLAGRNDVDSLVYFNKKMAEFSDDGKTFWGAYGHRWRKGLVQSLQSGKPLRPLDYIDQIQTAIDILRVDPRSRRTVLQMWDPGDLERVKHSPACKDVPCNLEILLDIRNGLLDPGPSEPTQPSIPATVANMQDALNQTYPFRAETLSRPKKRGRPQKGDTNHVLRDAHQDNQFLDMTVINRSNDMVWGCFGANYVHMSFLQEYIACALGVKVGVYHQVTNNLHVYEANWHPEKWLAGACPDPYQSTPDPYQSTPDSYPNPPLFSNSLHPDVPIQKYQAQFDDDCAQLFTFWDQYQSFKSISDNFSTPFFRQVVHPLVQAWNLHLARDYPRAILCAERITYSDWRLACSQWLARRQIKWDSKPRINPQTAGELRETSDASHSHIPPKSN